MADFISEISFLPGDINTAVPGGPIFGIYPAARSYQSVLLKIPNIGPQRKAGNVE
jgi:hypothetical protein